MLNTKKKPKAFRMFMPEYTTLLDDTTTYTYLGIGEQFIFCPGVIRVNRLPYDAYRATIPPGWSWGIAPQALGERKTNLIAASDVFIKLIAHSGYPLLKMQEDDLWGDYTHNIAEYTANLKNVARYLELVLRIVESKKRECKTMLTGSGTLDKRQALEILEFLSSGRAQRALTDCEKAIENPIAYLKNQFYKAAQE